MPEAAQAGDAYQVRVKGLIEGQETNNVWHFKCETAVDDVELRLILAIIQCFNDTIKQGMSNRWSLTEVVWKRVSPTLGIEHVNVPDPAIQGDIASDHLPSFCSAVVSIRTAQGGRSKRGRTYLPAIPEAATSGSAFDTAQPYWTQLVAFLLCLASKFVDNAELGSNRISMQVYSRKLGGATFPYGDAGFEKVIALKPNLQLGTTRSRKVGRGS